MKQAPSLVLEIEMEPVDMTELANRPHGGYGNRDTRGGLSDRNGTTRPTHTRDEMYGGGSMHASRTRLCDEMGPRQLREATEADGVAFSERMRADLDDDLAL